MTPSNEGASIAAREQPKTLLVTQAQTERPTIKLEFDEEPANEAVSQTLRGYKSLPLSARSHAGQRL